MRPPSRSLRASLAFLATFTMTCGTSGPVQRDHAITGTMSGTVTRGVTVVLGGDGIGTTMTDEAGQFGFAGLRDGNYTVTPSHRDHAFYPAHRSAAVTGVDVRGQDFVASRPHALSGKVSGSASAGVVVSLYEPVEGTYFTETTTDTSGRYHFAGLADGYYGVVPAAESHVFVPGLLYVTLSGTDLEGQDFAASVPASISGAVTGAVRAGVNVVLASDASGWWDGAAMTTDASGRYTFSGLPSANYLVTPSLSGYTFDPSSTPLTLSGVDVAGVDFVAALIPQPPDVTPPSVPGDLSATCSCEFQPRYNTSWTVDRVTWSPSVDTHSGVCGYRIYRDPSLRGTYYRVAQVEGGATTWVGRGMCLSYKVSAVDCAGNESGLSSAARAGGLPCMNF